MYKDNPRRACAARVTVVGFVCVSVCVPFCLPVCPSVKPQLTSRVSACLEIDGHVLNGQRRSKNNVGFAPKPICCRDPALSLSYSIRTGRHFSHTCVLLMSMCIPAHTHRGFALSAFHFINVMWMDHMFADCFVLK